MKQLTTILALILLLLSACRKERQSPEWASDLLFPILYAEIGPENITADSLLQVNSNNSIDLAYKSRVFNLLPSELIDIPDTTITNAYGLLGFPVVFSPGQTIFSQTTQTGYSIENNAGLRKAVIRSGRLEFEVRSEIKERTVFSYTIPKALKNGQSFQFSMEVPAATANQAAVKKASFDLSGYSLNLSGINGNTINTFYSSFSGKVADDGSNVQVNPGDSLVLNSSFIDLIPEYIQGYFGQQDVTSGQESSAVDFFNNITAGSYNLEDVTADITITNYIGAEATFSLKSLATINKNTGAAIALTHPIINQEIHINRASEVAGQSIPVNPSIYQVNLNKLNSNVLPLIENIPGAFSFEGEALINPLGNVSGWNDFLYADYGLTVDVDIIMPLQFSAQGLTMVDTLPLDSSINQVLRNVNGGNLILYAENGFPFSAKVQLTPLTNTGISGTPLFTEELIAAAPVNTAGKAESATNSTLRIPLNDEAIFNLMNSEKMLVRIILDTQPPGNRWKIYNDYKLNLRLVADLDYQIRVK